MSRPTLSSAIQEGDLDIYDDRGIRSGSKGHERNISQVLKGLKNSQRCVLETNYEQEDTNHSELSKNVLTYLHHCIFSLTH